MHLFHYITTVLFSSLILITPLIADDEILVEPIKNDFILGKAIGKYSIVNGDACFSITRLELKLSPKQKNQEKQYVTGLRFGLAIPFKGSTFDYLAQTDDFSVNSELTVNKPIIRKNFKTCLKLPERAKKEKYFLDMQIWINHPKYGSATTYAHNKAGYIKLMPKYVLEDGRIIEANSGEVDNSNLGKKNTKHKLSVDMKLVKYSYGQKWPPTAYAGFFQGENRSNSFQFLIMRRNSEENFIVAGYRLLKDSKEVLVESVATFKLNEKIHINMEIINGTVLISLEGKEPIIVKTDLKEVRPYIAVSSGAANFNNIQP